MKITVKTIGKPGKEKSVPRGCNQCGKPLRTVGVVELCRKCLKKQ